MLAEMKPLAIVRRRLIHQRLGGDRFDTAGDVVRWLGAVQAQEFAEVMWSLAERTQACGHAEVEAAFGRGDFIRTHALRPTWHFLANEDVRWLLRLTRPRVHALNRYMYRKLDLDANVLQRGHDVLARTLSASGPLTRRELAAHLAAAGVEAEGLRLGYVLMHAELEEVICSGPRRGRSQTYALLDDRVPVSPTDERPRESSVDELVVRYFRSHGPATVNDFTAWSSLTVADTKAALARVASELDRDEDETGKAWYYAKSSPATTSDRLSGAFLVPMYDETIVAYQDLRVALANEPPRPGLLDRAIVIDGRTVGSWRRTLSARSVLIEATLFGPLTPSETQKLHDVAARFGAFLGLEPVLTTTVAV